MPHRARWPIELAIALLVGLGCSRPGPEPVLERATPRSLASAAELAAAIASPADPQWFGVYLGERKIGHARLGLRPSRAGEPGAVVVDSRLEVSMSPADGAASRPLVLTDARYYAAAPPHQLLEVRIREEGAGGVNEIRAVSRAEGVQITSSAGAGSPRGRAAPPTGETLATPLSQLLLRPEWVEAGDRAELLELDVESGSDRTVEVTVAARRQGIVFGVEAEVAELAVRQRGERTTTRAVVASGGRALRATVGRFSFRAQDRERARSGIEGFDYLSTAVTIDRRLGDPGRIARLELAVESGAELAWPAAANQRVSRGPEGASRTWRVVVAEGPGDPVLPEERAAALRPTAEVDADHRAIRAAAARVAGDGDDRARARRLLRWVHASLAKVHATHLVSASQVLHRRIGDCTEHALLFVALARAAGIPARRVSGLVYLGDDVAGFGWHAWAEVALDGRWERVDPSWNEPVANATHITMGIGESAEWIAALGDLRIRVLGVEARR